jgi:hypothetical protein
MRKPKEKSKGKLPSAREVCCLTLDRMLAEEANAHKAGLVVFALTNMLTGDSRVAGVVCKRSARDNGVLLNFCPFCGHDLRPMLGGAEREIVPTVVPGT